MYLFLNFCLFKLAHNGSFCLLTSRILFVALGVCEMCDGNEFQQLWLRLENVDDARPSKKCVEDILPSSSVSFGARGARDAGTEDAKQNLTACDDMTLLFCTSTASATVDRNSIFAHTRMTCNKDVHFVFDRRHHYCALRHKSIQVHSFPCLVCPSRLLLRVICREHCYLSGIQ